MSSHEKIEILKITIDTLKKSSSHETKGIVLFRLIENYILYEESDSIRSRIEQLFTGISYFSDQYFYHVFEHSFQDFYALHKEHLQKNDSGRLKLVKILLTLSCRRDNFNSFYLDEARSLLKKSDFINNADCTALPDSTTFKNFKNLWQLNFYKMILFCQGDAKNIFALRKFFLVSL